MNLIEEFIYLQEVNRIVQGLAKTTGKPQDHIQSLWKDTEKEVVVKHKYGVTDRYKQIGKIVRAKMGVKGDPEDDVVKDDEKDKNKEDK